MKTRCGHEIQRYTALGGSTQRPISDSKGSTPSERIRTEFICIQLWEQIQLTCLQWRHETRRMAPRRFLQQTVVVYKIT